MNARQRHTIVVLVVVLISLTLLAAPARGGDWFGVGFGSHGLSIGFGSTDWAVWGASWSNPGWSVDYHVALSGYGDWVWVDGLGQCWQPWVRPDWRPFNHGRWVWTSLGWTWVSYEPWGYFPHHFGHWAMAPAGWVWVPGTSYHPANVVWVAGGPWVGWYPRPPFGWHHHHGHLHHGHHNGWGDDWGDARYATYVGWHDLGSDDLGRYAVGAAVVRDGGRHAAPRDSVAAPTRHELSQRGVVVPEMSLERRAARIEGREVMLARPREAADSIERNAGAAAERALAPQAVTTLSRRSAEPAAAGRSVAPRQSAATGRQAAAARGDRDGAARSEQSMPGRSNQARRPISRSEKTRPSSRASAAVTEQSGSAARSGARERREPARAAASAKDETTSPSEVRERRSDRGSDQKAQGSTARRDRR